MSQRYLFGGSVSFSDTPRSGEGACSSPEVERMGLSSFRLEGQSLVFERQLEKAHDVTYFVVHPNLKFVYIGHPTKPFITKLELDSDFNPVASEICDLDGMNACFLAISRDQQSLLTANFSSGSITRFTLADDGQITDSAILDLANLSNGGAPSHGGTDVPVPPSEPHQIYPTEDEQIFLVPDRGRDCVHVIKNMSDKISYLGRHQLPPGQGPRHLVAHPHVAGLYYLVNEFKNSVSTLHITPHEFEILAESTTLPENATASTAAAIMISQDGAHLYATNRGHDSIAHFCLSDPRKPQLKSIVPTDALTPRFAMLDQTDSTMLVGSQSAHRVHVYERHPETGVLTESYNIPYPGSRCIQEINIAGH